jgi:hypothetical protein
METSKNESCSAEDTWFPRVWREASLKNVEARLFEEPKSIELLFSRAQLLVELGRIDEAKRAYLEILMQSPTHSGTLNNFGTLLQSTGFTTAARTCFTEAVRVYPGNPMGHVNLAVNLLSAKEFALAREHLEKALEIAPDLAEAHQGYASLLWELGDEKAAEEHRRAAFQNRSVIVLPYRGEVQPVPVLLLISAMGGNMPICPFLDDTIFLVTVIVTEFYEISKPLPPHRLIINALSDADLCTSGLEAAQKLTSGTSAPVLNLPAMVLATGRLSNAGRLGQVPGIKTPIMLNFSRSILEDPDGLSVLSAYGLRFPFLVRTPGFHNGQYFYLIENTHDLAIALDSLPGDEITVLQFLDARNEDGKIRKYRVMVIDGEIYPLHAAISSEWKIHYNTAQMADYPEHRAEDAAFLNNMSEVLGPRAMAALVQMREILNLDYVGVDFSLNVDGEILLFEANPAMVVLPPEPDERWAYRRAPVARIQNAIRMMLSRMSAV